MCPVTASEDCPFTAVSRHTACRWPVGTTSRWTLSAGTDETSAVALDAPSIGGQRERVGGRSRPVRFAQLVLRLPGRRADGRPVGLRPLVVGLRGGRAPRAPPDHRAHPCPLGVFGQCVVGPTWGAGPLVWGASFGASRVGARSGPGRPVAVLVGRLALLPMTVSPKPQTPGPDCAQVAVKLTWVKMRLPFDADAWTSMAYSTPRSRNSVGTVRLVRFDDRVVSMTRSSFGEDTMTS